MPELSDSELRLALVILRHTIGWQRERLWMNHVFLKERMGRSSAAISRAIDGLVRTGVIEVTTEGKQVLSSAASRRKHRSGLFFRLTPRYRDADPAELARTATGITTVAQVLDAQGSKDAPVRSANRTPLPVPGEPFVNIYRFTGPDRPEWIADEERVRKRIAERTRQQQPPDIEQVPEDPRARGKP